MLRRLWRLFTRLFQQLLGNTPRRQSIEEDSGVMYPPPPLTDTEIEIRFMQLLEGVDEGYGRDWVLGWLESMESRISTECWLGWLRRFEERLVSAGGGHQELLRRMVCLGELGVGVVGDLALDIGNRQGVEEEGTNRQDAKGAKEERGEEEGAEVWFERGLQQAMVGDLEAAVVSWGRAIEIKRDYHEAWYNRGIALGDLGRFEEAIASYSRAIEIQPDYHEAWCNRGVALVNLGRFEEAIASYSSAIEIKR